MRLLFTLSIFVILISPLYASDTVLVYEDFEGATVGTNLNTLGWTGDDGVTISDILVDQGQSVCFIDATTDWPTIVKEFTYSPIASEQYELTATLWSPTTWDNYSHVQLSNLSASSRLHVALGYNTLTFGYIDNTGTYSDELSVPMLLTSMDIKVVASGSSFDAYWKENGAAEWTSVGHVDGGEGLGIDIADFNAVQLFGHGGYLGGVDTVRLAVSTTAVAIPGDANGDQKVDGSDVTILAGNWQVGVDGTVEATWAMGDFNGDKKVDGSDVTILAGNWQAGVTSAASSVPEPSTIVLLLMATASLLIWKRR